MKLIKVANSAATEISNTLATPLSKVELDQIEAIIGKAMEKAVVEASQQHVKVCNTGLIHDQDLAHKISDEMERRKIALIANLSSLR